MADDNNKNIENVFDRIDEILKESIETGLSSYAETLRALVVKQIDKMGLNVSGDLRKSVTYEVREKLSHFLLRVGTNIEYAVYVHEGTKPHWTPIKPILKWVHKKGLAGTYNPKTRRRQGSKKRQLKEDFAVAKKIQWGIAKRGTKPHPFMKLVFDQEKDKMAIQIAKEIGKALRNAV